MSFITFGFLGFITASVLALLAFLAVKRKFPGKYSHQTSIRRQFVIAPFVAVLWILAAFLIHVSISHHIAHQDCGLGMSPDPFVRLPNGYTLGSGNTYDGYIVAPGFKTDVPVAGRGYVRALVTLHWNGDEFRGTQFDFKTSKVRAFVFNTKTYNFVTNAIPDTKDQVCDSKDPACVDAWTKANDEAQLGSESYWKLYWQYRHQWPTYVFVLLVIAGELCIVFYLVRLWRTESQRSALDSQS
ncbi:hypothetical protein [Terriglobus sp. RCC_193]|uniref:hypothetical protein n=1 Tax=Terriglobus sp. RCC_193 TaxID=3239218 RepID=UPI0035269E45